MPISHLALTKHLDGRPVLPEEIKKGLKVYYPSGLGGVIPHECVSVTDDKAVFKSINKDWPVSFEMLFNTPDFTLDDFEALSDALVAFCTINSWPSDEQRSLVKTAHSLGYASYISYTQASWTDEGIDAYHRAAS